jgi:hypothetical protein
MGDLSDFNDIARFMHSKEGEAHLTALREMLAGKTIVDIEFSNDVRRMSTTFHLADGKTFVAN